MNKKYLKIGLCVLSVIGTIAGFIDEFIEIPGTEEKES